jgi:hypothetical protein
MRSCYYCRRENVAGTGYLKSRHSHVGTPIPVCEAGTGCQDGRTYHGPLAAAHWPHEPCDYCLKHGRQPSI